jgi:membrane protease YdiL (CAAX protease family)
VGFLVAISATLVVVGIVSVFTTGFEEGEDTDATFTVVATLIQSAAFVATAVLFASFTRRPRAWHFGLRRTRLWPGVGWATLGLVSFYVLAAIYTVAVQPDAEQTVAEDLGSDEGTFGLIAAGFMIVCVAPVAEEFFFRGFFYRALRSRWAPLAPAPHDRLGFGINHVDVAGSHALLILPPLALLGFIFCVVYERTGSLYPVIAMHAVNNAIAYGAQADGWEVSVVLGPLMILACMLVPRITDPARPATVGG